MLKQKDKNIELIIQFIISTILVKLVIRAYGVENNTVYTVIAVGLLMYFIRNLKQKCEIIKNKNVMIASGIYSLLISTMIMLQSKMTFKNDVELGYLENTFSNFEFFDIIKVVIVFIIFYVIILNIIAWIKNKRFSILDNKSNNKTTEKMKNFKYWIIATILVAIPYIIYLLTYAPGAVLGDSLASITQGLGEVPYNNHHPVLYSMFVGIFMRIGQVFNSNNIGVMLYSIAQLTIISGIIGYFLVWLKKHKVKFEYILLTYLFFVANTVFAAYAIIMWKDPLFSAFVFLMTLYIFDIIKQNGEPLRKATGIIKFVILSILIAFFRNNGVLIVIGIYLIMLFYFRKKLLIFNIVNTIAIVAILAIQGPVYTKLGIISPTEESFAIPIQQIARTIAYDGNITEEQKEFINKIMPIEKWKEKYDPCLVDSIKWAPDFNKQFLAENKVQFLKTWAKMLPSNFMEYVKAYLFETYGFWTIETKNGYGFVDTYIIENGYDIERKDCIEMLTGKSIEEEFSKPDFLGSGTMIWIMLLSVVILIVNKKYKYILTLFPCFISWVSVMVATPVAFSLRYVFMLAYALPFIVMLPFMINNKEKTKGV